MRYGEIISQGSFKEIQSEEIGKQEDIDDLSVKPLKPLAMYLCTVASKIKDICTFVRNAWSKSSSSSSLGKAEPWTIWEPAWGLLGSK